jgi:hypothetical protein
LAQRRAPAAASTGAEEREGVLDCRANRLAQLGDDLVDRARAVEER